MNNKIFSNRYGYRKTSGNEISIRQEAPHELRGVIIDLAYECGFTPTSLRKLICKVLRKRPDRNNWSEYPNIDDENHYLIDSCEWYRIYDIIESICKKMNETPFCYKPLEFEIEVNEYFIDEGIGWNLKNGLIESRGSEIYVSIIESTNNALQQSAKNTTKKDIGGRCTL